jgi:hypothetical protein
LSLLSDDLVDIRRILLLRFLFQLVFAAQVLGARNDLIVDAGYNLLDHRVGGQKGGRAAKQTSNIQGSSFRIDIWAAVICAHDLRKL